MNRSIKQKSNSHPSLHKSTKRMSDPSDDINMQHLSMREPKYGMLVEEDEMLFGQKDLGKYQGKIRNTRDLDTEDTDDGESDEEIQSDFDEEIQSEIDSDDTDSDANSDTDSESNSDSDSKSSTHYEWYCWRWIH